MPGVPGTGGPVPKRSEQRRRRNQPETPVVKAPSGAEVEIPAADEKWHPVARRLYESFAKSGQSAFYEQSDWETAYLLAESLSRELKPQVIGTHPETGRPVRATIPIKGASLSAYLKVMTDLLTTEGARRRAGVELQRPQPDGNDDGGEDVAWIDDARRRLRAAD